MSASLSSFLLKLLKNHINTTSPVLRMRLGGRSVLRSRIRFRIGYCLTNIQTDNLLALLIKTPGYFLLKQFQVKHPDLDGFC